MFGNKLILEKLTETDSSTMLIEWKVLKLHS